MSAIWGIAAQHIDDSLRNIFDQMTAVMPYSDASTVNTLISDQVALGHSTIGTIHKRGFPLHCNDGSLISICGLPIWESGYHKNNTAASSGDDGNHDAQLLQYALKKDRLSELGGVYAFSKWDEKTKKLLIGTDRLGFGSLYYSYDSTKKIIYFSSRLRGLSNVGFLNQNVNYRAIIEFLKFGHPLGDKTFYSDINLVPPGSFLEFDLKGIKQKKYWSVDSIPIDHSMSYQNAVELNASAFKKAMARRISRCENLDTILLLSGGADSRRIAGELRAHGLFFESFTTRGFVENDSEGGIASDVAKTLGVKNTFIDLPLDGFVQKYWNRSNKLNDYECCLHQWLLPLSDKIPKMNAVNYDGLAGDIPIEGVFRASGFADPKNFNIVQSLDIKGKAQRIIGEKLELSFLNNRIKENLNPELLEGSVVEELFKYRYSENQLTLFFLQNRGRRSILLGSNRILRNKIESLYPFLDIDVLTATLSIPYEHRLKHTLRRDIVKFAYPELSVIPYTQYKSQVKGYSENLSVAYRREKALQLRNNIIKFSFRKKSPLRQGVAPKLLLRYLFSYFGHYQPPYELGLTFQIFYEWFAENRDRILDFK